MSKKPQKLDQKLIGYKYDFGNYKLNAKQACLYSLGIGLNLDPLRKEDLKYTYELDKNFTVFPTITSCMGQQRQQHAYVQNPYIPKFDLHQTLHAQERLTLIHDKIHLNKQYKLQAQIVDVVDKGQNKGAFIYLRIYGYLINQKSQKQLAYYVDKTQFAKQLGGSQIKSSSKITSNYTKQNSKQFQQIKAKTSLNQALLYRLVSDANPLHADPDTAIKAKFQRPILHGLSTYGTIIKSIVQQMLGNDTSKIKELFIRFTGHVFPGQTLKIKVWRQNQLNLIYEAQTLQRKKNIAIGTVKIRQISKL